MFYIDQCEQLLMRSWRKAWSVFAEAYQADARDFGVHVLYSLTAWLNWRLNHEDPTELITAHLIPAPVCNLEDDVPEFVHASIDD